MIAGLFRMCRERCGEGGALGYGQALQRRGQREPDQAGRILAGHARKFR